MYGSNAGMIDPNWQLVDLDPYTWRAIGKFIDPGMYIRAGSPDENGLYVIHDGGTVLSVVETTGTRRPDLGLERIERPESTARALFDSGEWDRVHVIDRKHLQSVSTEAQQLSNRSLELDAYYRHVFDLVWGNAAGYAVVPEHPRSWNGWTYQRIVEFVSQLQAPASLALGVMGEDGSLVIGLLGEVSEGSFRKVTTFESLPFDPSDVSIDEEFLDRIWSHLLETAFPPAAVLLCTESVFDRWVNGAGKARTIEDAIASGTAILRLRDGPRLSW
jgi:hypothetical protein